MLTFGTQSTGPAEYQLEDQRVSRNRIEVGTKKPDLIAQFEPLIRIFVESRSSHLFSHRSYRVISDRCNCTRDACAPTVDLSPDVSLRVTSFLLATRLNYSSLRANFARNFSRLAALNDCLEQFSL